MPPSAPAGFAWDRALDAGRQALADRSQRIQSRDSLTIHGQSTCPRSGTDVELWFWHRARASSLGETAPLPER